jgi:hypothetical protein
MISVAIRVEVPDSAIRHRMSIAWQRKELSSPAGTVRQAAPPAEPHSLPGVSQYARRCRSWLPRGDENHLRKETPTIAEFFQKNGYTTYFSGKWHMGDKPDAYPTEHGLLFISPRLGDSSAAHESVEFVRKPGFLSRAQLEGSREQRCAVLEKICDLSTVRALNSR